MPSVRPRLHTIRAKKDGHTRKGTDTETCDETSYGDLNDGPVGGRLDEYADGENTGPDENGRSSSEAVGGEGLGQRTTRERENVSAT